MKSPGEVRQKLKQVRYRHFKRLLLMSFPSGGGDWDGDEVSAKKDEIAKLLSQPAPSLAREFPDLAALVWVLEEDSPPTSGETLLVGSLDGVLLWADTEEEASHVRHLLDTFAKPKLSWWRNLLP
jgi:hypothetical protein